MIRTALFVLAFLAFGSTSAWAQFAGDVFFAEPSVTAPENGTVTLEVQAFTGARVLGAAHLVFRFDPAQLAIDEVRTGDAPELDSLFVSSSPGAVSVVLMNGVSLADPFGTVSLMEVVARPLAPPGTRVDLSIEVVTLVDEESMSLPDTQGFAAQITVTPGASLQQNSHDPAPPSAAPPTADDVEEALRLRRPGHRVPLARGVWQGPLFLVETVDVFTLDPFAPSD